MEVKRACYMTCRAESNPNLYDFVSIIRFMTDHYCTLLSNLDKRLCHQANAKRSSFCALVIPYVTEEIACLTLTQKELFSSLFEIVCRCRHFV